MERLLSDFRHAGRALRRSPGFTLVAIASLCLGIGANSVIFALVNGLLFKPLPVAQPERLVRIGATERGQGFGAFSHPEYLELRDQARSLEGLIAHRPNTVTLSVADDPRTEWMELVSGDYFMVLGVRPTLGRAFLPEEDRTPGAAPVVVISHDLWRRRFGADSRAVGATVRVNGHPYTVVGVAPRGFHGTFAGFGVDLWVPTMMMATALPASGALENRADRFLMLIGRRRPDASVAAVASELQVIARRLATAGDSNTSRDYGITVAEASGVHPFVAGLVTAFLALLQGIVGLVLLIACANLTNLLLARAAARRRELAVRAALGAGRARLMRYLLAESLILALAGGVLGALLAQWAAGLLSTVRLPAGVPISLDLRLDGRVILFTFAATLVTVVAAGLWPAWRASRPDVLGELRVAGATAARARLRARNFLVGVQVAVATLLLLCADLLVQSLRHSRALDPGFDPTNVLLLQAEPEQLGYDEPRVRALWAELRAGAERLPGVEAASLALLVPLGSRGDQMAMSAADRSGPPVPHDYNLIEPGYIRALRIPLLAGRDFRPDDDTGAADVALVTASAARRFFGEAQPLGRMLRIVDRAGRDRRALVVGVLGEVRHGSLAEPVDPLVYLPSRQWYRADMVLHVRAAVATPGLAGPLAAMARAVEPDLAVTVEPMERAMAFSLIPMRVAGGVVGSSGLIGLLLAVFGVFGVVAYAVAQRTREMGIRLALGARPGQVLRHVVTKGARPALIGLAAGVVAGVGASRLLSGLLVGVSPLNLETLILLPAGLAAVSLFAAYLPARRVTRVDPVIVLRDE